MPSKKQASVIEEVCSKRLSIEILDGSPIFEFKGLWTGKDVDNVSRLLYREYRRCQRTVRRSQPVVTQPEVSDARPE